MFVPFCIMYWSCTSTQVDFLGKRSEPMTETVEMISLSHAALYIWENECHVYFWELRYKESTQVTPRFRLRVGSA